MQNLKRGRINLSASFASRFSDLIEESGKKLVSIAEQTQISTGSLSRYQNGKTEPTATQIIKLAQYFGVTTDYLLGISDLRFMNMRKRTIREITGLSENAIDVLENPVPKNAPEILSQIVESKDFARLVSRINEYRVLDQNSEKAYAEDIKKHFVNAFSDTPDTTLHYSNESEILDLKEYQITKTMTAILRQIIGRDE